MKLKSASIILVLLSGMLFACGGSSSGSGSSVSVANVVGLTQLQALVTITETSLVVGVVTYQSSETVAAATVISQSPTAGTSVATGSAVNFVVSSGTAGVTGLASIAGVYESFDHYPGGVVDEWYLGIDDQGFVTTYDYMGDSFDNIANCYDIDRDWFRFVHISGNLFSAIFDGDDLGDVFIEFDQGGLLITSLDGEQLAIGPKVDIAVSDFEAAECT
jgi:hypothetical protein